MHIKKNNKGNIPTTVHKAYFSLSETAFYTGISERLLRDLLKSPINPIPHFRIGSAGRIIRLKKADIDSWFESFKSTSQIDIDTIVNELIK